MYWGYHDNTSGYQYVTNWRSIGNNKYLTFFDDAQSNPYVDVYVKFQQVAGYRPANYKTGYVFALIDSRDMS